MSLITRYNNVRFRSRLEARWAAYFDFFKIKWEYEPRVFWVKGFVKKSVGYCPDFQLCFGVPENVWIEIKPPKTLTRRELLKTRAFGSICKSYRVIVSGQILHDYRILQIYRNKLIECNEKWTICLGCRKMAIRNLYGEYYTCKSCGLWNSLGRESNMCIWEGLEFASSYTFEA